MRCRPRGGHDTEVSVRYLFVGLSDVGNRDITAMSPAPFAEKMRRWQGWIEACLSEGTG